MRRWQKKQSAEIFRNPRVTVFEDDVVQPDGSDSKYTWIDIQPAVFVIAVADDDKVVIVRQHRYPVDEVTIELPAGQFPVGEDAIEHGLRELKEETGITAASGELLGEFILSAARIPRRRQVILARDLDLSMLATSGQEGDEAIESAELVEQSRLVEMIAQGEVVDSNTITALTLYWSKFGFPKQK